MFNFKLNNLLLKHNFLFQLTRFPVSLHLLVLVGFIIVYLSFQFLVLRGTSGQEASQAKLNNNTEQGKIKKEDAPFYVQSSDFGH